jgi:glycosyltransferase involved in cell wall biosynthesis
LLAIYKPGAAYAVTQFSNTKPTVDILLATYNGARYLPAQLDSLLRQTYTQWRVLAHDDGSTDDTLQILRHYASRHPERIVLVHDEILCGSACNNFAHLLGLAEANYVAFCDQDDVWLPQKLQLSMAQLRAAEQESNAQTPLAVFTDLMVVDEGLVELAPSFWAFQGLSPSLAQSLSNLAVRNCVTGCTMVMNRAAVTASLPVLPSAYMHDWWCALSVLAQGGKVVPCRQATVLYRQHGGNSVGARPKGLGALAAKLAAGRGYWKDMSAIYHQAKFFSPGLTWFKFLLRKLPLWLRSQG